MKKVEVNKSVCIGCGTCVSLCPECFQLGEDGKAQVKEGCDTSKCNMEEIADSCPMHAIEVTEENE